MWRPCHPCLQNPDQIEAVFWHLIDNAIKYTRGRRPEIHITARQSKGGWHVLVSDNGIGIQPRHRHDIFVIFKRLGFMEEVDGDGFGLALCNRIIDRHNGRITVDENSNQGSTFRIELASA